ncbi:hypothetical protein M409DRAFT_22059 [Zasmidium cellare ATCC 36951]|uniref:AB hydrolase-1 domain-containing protein n=1 Tax=Zasmidium cellare ATCC 36951 TaxID=1080233 RepID=A0A6A6CMR0_ZASCE|nr:uncharacterized protein M409DRAFT_22059 [Zasmidium cellare ATCC 36951]KAF2167913.1 hypothetical protein M409DRAFT_22059 [Zasmidium cellare ATCC 36951]
MPSKPIEFKTIDRTTLRGHLYTPSSSHNATGKPLPCLVMAHGWSCVQEMELPSIAEHLTSTLPLAVLTYDHRNFGASDSRAGDPRREIVPAEQVNDLNDAVTFVGGLEGIDAERVGVWGYSYAGGHAICAGAADPRVRVVVATAPVVSGWGQAQRVIPPGSREAVWGAFAADRKARVDGAEPARIPVVSEDPAAPCTMPSRSAHAWFSKWEGKSSWVNDLTVRTSWMGAYMEPAGVIQYISPRSLLMLVAETDCEAPVELAIDAFEKAKQPKQLEILPRCGHFDIFDGPVFERLLKVTVEFLQERLLS